MGNQNEKIPKDIIIVGKELEFPKGRNENERLN